MNFYASHCDEIMSATVCNVLDVMLRTPGESINVTMKIKRIVFTFDGLLNVRLFAINQNGMIHQDQAVHNALLNVQFLLHQMQIAPCDPHHRCCTV